MVAGHYMKLLSTWPATSIGEEQNSLILFKSCIYSEGKMLQPEKLKRYLISLFEIICDVDRQWKFGEKGYLNKKSYFQTFNVHSD